MKIEFQVDTEFGSYCDALYFFDDAVPSETEIEAMKQDRVNRWVALVKDMRERGSEAST